MNLMVVAHTTTNGARKSPTGSVQKSVSKVQKRKFGQADSQAELDGPRAHRSVLGLEPKALTLSEYRRTDGLYVVGA